MEKFRLKGRNGTACAACHMYKRKCDGNRPCKRCVENGLDCIAGPAELRQRQKRLQVQEKIKSFSTDALSCADSCKRARIAAQDSPTIVPTPPSCAHTDSDVLQGNRLQYVANAFSRPFHSSTSASHVTSQVPLLNTHGSLPLNDQISYRTSNEIHTQQPVCGGHSHHSSSSTPLISDTRQPWNNGDTFSIGELSADVFSLDDIPFTFDTERVQPSDVAQGKVPNTADPHSHIQNHHEQLLPPKYFYVPQHEQYSSHSLQSHDASTGWGKGLRHEYDIHTTDPASKHIQSNPCTTFVEQLIRAVSIVQMLFSDLNSVCQQEVVRRAEAHAANSHVQPLVSDIQRYTQRYYAPRLSAGRDVQSALTSNTTDFGEHSRWRITFSSLVRKLATIGSQRSSCKSSCICFPQIRCSNIVRGVASLMRDTLSVTRKIAKCVSRQPSQTSPHIQFPASEVRPVVKVYIRLLHITKQVLGQNSSNVSQRRPTTNKCCTTPVTDHRYDDILENFIMELDVPAIHVVYDKHCCVAVSSMCNQAGVTLFGMDPATALRAVADGAHLPFLHPESALPGVLAEIDASSTGKSVYSFRGRFVARRTEQTTLEVSDTSLTTPKDMQLSTFVSFEACMYVVSDSYPHGGRRSLSIFLCDVQLDQEQSTCSYRQMCSGEAVARALVRHPKLFPAMRTCMENCHTTDPIVALARHQAKYCLGVSSREFFVWLLLHEPKMTQAFCEAILDRLLEDGFNLISLATADYKDLPPQSPFFKFIVRQAAQARIRNEVHKYDQQQFTQAQLESIRTARIDSISHMAQTAPDMVKRWLPAFGTRFGELVVP